LYAVLFSSSLSQ
jgi:hypothetical protein